MEVLERTDARLRAEGERTPVSGRPDQAARRHHRWGLRAGTLTLLAGPQGQGKTTFALQVARNAVGLRPHRPVLLLRARGRVAAAEAGGPRGRLVDPHEAPNLNADPCSLRGHRRWRRRPPGPAGGAARRRERPAPRRTRYAERLVTHRSTTSHTGIASMVEQIEDVRAAQGEAPLVIVDYLQKVHYPKDVSEDEQTTRITEQLKDLSIEFDCPVLAIAAADHEGLQPGTRLRARHLRGSTALAYEPDLVLILNTKSDIVARHHLMFDGNSHERFRNWSVLTVEKNRAGHDGAELEFRKRFDQGRFESDGSAVAERLVDERVYVESRRITPGAPGRARLPARPRCPRPMPVVENPRVVGAWRGRSRRCGVASTRGCWRSTWSGRQGLPSSYHVEAGAPRSSLGRRGAAQARRRQLFDETGTRGVHEVRRGAHQTEFGGTARDRGAAMESTRWSDAKSRRRRARRGRPLPTPAAAARPSVRFWLQAITRMPNARPTVATCWPRLPRPTTPRVDPARSVPTVRPHARRGPRRPPRPRAGSAPGSAPRSAPPAGVAGGRRCPTR